MAACPWTKSQSLFHKMMAEIASKKGKHQRFMAWAERAVYGKYKPALSPEYLELPLKNRK
jgi:hypothetical protein